MHARPVAVGPSARHARRLGGSRGNELLTSINAGVLLVLIGAEWPRLAERFGSGGRARRERARQKQTLKLITSERDEFAASVERDLEKLPTIEERDRS